MELVGPIFSFRFLNSRVNAYVCSFYVQSSSRYIPLTTMCRSSSFLKKFLRVNKEAPIWHWKERKVPWGNRGPEYLLSVGLNETYHEVVKTVKNRPAGANVKHKHNSLNSFKIIRLNDRELGWHSKNEEDLNLILCSIAIQFKRIIEIKYRHMYDPHVVWRSLAERNKSIQ